MSGFTPGPWQSHDDWSTQGVITIIGNVDGEIHSDGTTSNSYDTICVCEDEFGERLPNVAANVRLIISAPELLTYLTLALGVIDASKIVWMGADKARAAIAKAGAA